LFIISALFIYLFIYLLLFFFFSFKTNTEAPKVPPVRSIQAEDIQFKMPSISDPSLEFQT